MRKPVLSVLLLSVLGVSGCGGEDATAPEFPRAFTSVSTTCVMRIGLEQDPNGFVETVIIETIEESTEPLFPEHLCISDVRRYDRTGTLLDRQADFLLPCFDSDHGDWSLTISIGPTDGGYTGGGTGYGRSIEFEMEPFEVCDPPCACGFATSGTIQ